MSQRPARGLAAASMLVPFAADAWPGEPQAPAGEEQPAAARAPAQPQPRPHSEPIAVDPALVTVDHGDTVVVKWPGGDEETVRILGIDSPETRHDVHKIPFDQPFGPEARAFAQGAFAIAATIELTRSATLDPYGRTRSYSALEGKNYSVLIVKAKLAEETFSIYGDNGLQARAAEVLAAAKAAGPVPFEPPHVFRKRMRTVSEAMPPF